jgi:hypothetical protein
MGGSSSSAKPPPPTPEEKAMEYRTNIGLRKERARTEKMLKQQAQSGIGVKSMLKGIKNDNTLKQKDVKHSNDMSSERREYLTANLFEKQKIRRKYGSEVLGLPNKNDLTGIASKASLLRLF